MLYGRTAMKHHYDYMLQNEPSICMYVNDAHEQLGINLITLREGVTSMAVNMIDAQLMICDRCMASVTIEDINDALKRSIRDYISLIDGYAVMQYTQR